MKELTSNKKTQTENIDKNKMDYSEHKNHSENQKTLKD